MQENVVSKIKKLISTVQVNGRLDRRSYIGWLALCLWGWLGMGFCLTWTDGWFPLLVCSIIGCVLMTLFGVICLLRCNDLGLGKNCFFWLLR